MQITGTELRGMTRSRLVGILGCSSILPSHVVKKRSQDYALLHFEDQEDASNFFYVYRIVGTLLCASLRGVTVNRALTEDRDSVEYLEPEGNLDTPIHYSCAASGSKDYH